MSIYNYGLDNVSTVIFMSSESDSIKLIEYNSTIAVSGQVSDMGHLYNEVSDMSNEEEYDDADLHMALDEFNDWSGELQDVNIDGEDYCFNPKYQVTPEEISALLEGHAERIKW